MFHGPHEGTEETAYPSSASLSLSPAPPVGNCSTPFIVHDIGLSSGGQSHSGCASASDCCAICEAAGASCAAWTYHPVARSCVTSSAVLPHNSSGTQGATSGSKTKIPPKPWPSPPPPGHHAGGSGFGPCPILNGSDGAVTEQYALMGANASSPPKLYDMLGIDDKYDAAAEGFIRQSVLAQRPFFFCESDSFLDALMRTVPVSLS